MILFVNYVSVELEKLISINKKVLKISVNSKSQHTVCFFYIVFFPIFFFFFSFHNCCLEPSHLQPDFLYTPFVFNALFALVTTTVPPTLPSPYHHQNKALKVNIHGFPLSVEDI